MTSPLQLLFEAIDQLQDEQDLRSKSCRKSVSILQLNDRESFSSIDCPW
jgi:hypothetical protein